MIGQTISHYKILEKLGEGGMGVVYKAEDTKLDRHVALKFLPHHLTSNEDAKKRFVHEAKAASALDHPNICNVHEIDETTKGHLFIAMAYYEGESLRDRLERGTLEVQEALDIVLQAAAGLARAHEKDIVHRDITPANILITTEEVIKIVDFGLAKLKGRTKVTKSGTTVGTVAYMSPEQARGEEVDARSDIFSLGVVLYEVLTGQRPFPGAYEAEVVYGIINKQPLPVAHHRTDLPNALQKILDLALAKDREKRYQSILSLSADLQTVLSTVCRKECADRHAEILEPLGTRRSTPRETFKKFISFWLYGRGRWGFLIVGLLLIVIPIVVSKLRNRKSPNKLASGTSQESSSLSISQRPKDRPVSQEVQLVKQAKFYDVKLDDAAISYDVFPVLDFTFRNTGRTAHQLTRVDFTVLECDAVYDASLYCSTPIEAYYNASLILRNTFPDSLFRGEAPNSISYRHAGDTTSIAIGIDVWQTIPPGGVDRFRIVIGDSGVFAYLKLRARFFFDGRNDVIESEPFTVRVFAPSHLFSRYSPSLSMRQAAYSSKDTVSLAEIHSYIDSMAANDWRVRTHSEMVLQSLLALYSVSSNIPLDSEKRLCLAVEQAAKDENRTVRLEAAGLIQELAWRKGPHMKNLYLAVVDRLFEETDKDIMVRFARALVRVRDKEVRHKLDTFMEQVSPAIREEIVGSMTWKIFRSDTSRSR